MRRKKEVLIFPAIIVARHYLPKDEYNTPIILSSAWRGWEYSSRISTSIVIGNKSQQLYLLFSKSATKFVCVALGPICLFGGSCLLRWVHWIGISSCWKALSISILCPWTPDTFRGGFCVVHFFWPQHYKHCTRTWGILQQTTHHLDICKYPFICLNYFLQWAAEAEAQGGSTCYESFLHDWCRNGFVFRCEACATASTSGSSQQLISGSFTLWNAASGLNGGPKVNVVGPTDFARTTLCKPAVNACYWRLYRMVPIL